MKTKHPIINPKKNEYDVFDTKFKIREYNFNLSNRNKPSKNPFVNIEGSIQESINESLKEIGETKNQEIIIKNKKLIKKTIKSIKD